MEPVEEIELLSAHRGAAGSDAERRTAVHLRDRLAGLGREAELQAIDARPRFGLAHAVHLLLAIAGSVIAVDNAPLGATLVLIGALGTALDVSGRLALVRRLTGRRASQNVHSPEHGGKPGTLVLVAHCDVARASGAWSIAQHVLRDPWRAMLIAMALLLACCAARALGAEGTALTAVQFAPTVLLILAVAALIDLELSPAGNGRADAAGAATVLRLAGELGGRLEHFDLWVVFTGARGPFALGMGAWLRRHRKQLDRETTAILCVDAVGDGDVRFTRREGPVATRRTHRQLAEICAEIAEDDGLSGSYRARPLTGRERSDAVAALGRRLPAITVGCPGDQVSPAGLERAHGFSRELIECLDADVGPLLAREASNETDGGEPAAAPRSQKLSRPPARHGRDERESSLIYASQAPHRRRPL